MWSRVKEATNGSGWIGYAHTEPALTQALPGSTHTADVKVGSSNAGPETFRGIAAGGDDDSDADLHEAIRLSLQCSAASANAESGTTVDLTTDVDDDPDLAEAVRLSLTCNMATELEVGATSVPSTACNALALE